MSITLIRLAAIVLVLSLPRAIHAQEARAPASAEIIEIDGLKVRVVAVGLKERRPGEPVIVFEAGATNSLDAWAEIVPEVASLAPVVAYDRAGLGESEWDEIRPTPQHVTGRLRRILSRLGASPPYLLVGHSWGGMLIHYYAGLHPSEIAGIVFVDPAPVLTQDLSGNFAPFKAIGADPTGFDIYWSSFAILMSKASPAARAEFDVYRALVNSDFAERDLRPLPKVPTAVLVAGKYMHLPFYDDYPFDSRAYFEADLRHRLSLLQEWALASDNGLLVLSRAATHTIPRDDPQLVSWSIKWVLDHVKSGSH